MTLDTSPTRRDLTPRHGVLLRSPAAAAGGHGDGGHDDDPSPEVEGRLLRLLAEVDQRLKRLEELFSPGRLLAATAGAIMLILGTGGAVIWQTSAQVAHLDELTTTVREESARGREHATRIAELDAQRRVHDQMISDLRDAQKATARDARAREE